MYLCSDTRDINGVKLLEFSPDHYLRGTVIVYDDEGGAVAQPAINPDKPHMVYPKEIYELLMTTPDEVVTQRP